MLSVVTLGGNRIAYARCKSGEMRARQKEGHDHERRSVVTTNLKKVDPRVQKSGNKMRHVVGSFGGW